MQNFANQQLGQYKISSEIGRGGMAIVYRAYQASLNRHVAIKVLPPHFTFDSVFVERFLHEARAAASLRHPNIVTIHDVGVENGIYYIVMEEIPGQALSTVMQRERGISTARIISILGQIASALDFAHAKGVVHRDIKPSNILVAADDHATLTDFGIAKAAATSGLTRTGTIVGTPEYMSPEQALGAAVDRRSDIYSLGIICYEMLGGRVPFAGETLAVMHAQAYLQPPSLRTLNPGIAPEVERVVNKALAKKPDQRFATASGLVSALVAAASGRCLTPPPLAKTPARGAARPAPAPVPPGSQPEVVTVLAPLSEKVTPATRRVPVWLLPAAGVLFGITLLVALVTVRSPAMMAPAAQATVAPTIRADAVPPPTATVTAPSFVSSPAPEPTSTARAASDQDQGALVSSPSATPSRTSTPTASATLRSTITAGRTATASPAPARTSTSTPSPVTTAPSVSPTSTPSPSRTVAPPTHTPVRPIGTSAPPTNTLAPPPTNTAVPPTNTAVPPTNTPVPPTNTPVPPTNTLPPPTDTPIPPTDTPIPPTDTPEPIPTDTPEPIPTP